MKRIIRRRVIDLEGNIWPKSAVDWEISVSTTGLKILDELELFLKLHS